MYFYRVALRMVFLFLVCATGCATPSIMATRSVQLGDLHSNQNNYEQAARHYEDYLKVTPQLGVYRNTEMEAEVRRKLAQCYSMQNRYDRSAVHLQEALRLDSAINNNTLGVIEDHRALGMLQAWRGNYRLALHYLNRAIALNEGMQGSAKTIKKESILGTYLAISQVKMALGDFEDAEQMALKAEALLAATPGNEDAAMEIALLRGIIHREKGDLESAVKLITKSRKLAGKNLISPTRQLQAMAQVWLMRGEYEEALRNQLEALKYARKSGVIPQIISALLRLGDIYNTLGDRKKAEQSYLEAMRMHANTSGTKDSKLTIARPGSEDLTKSLEFYESQGARTGAALAALKLGRFMMKKSEYDSAQGLLEKAEEYFTLTQSTEGQADVQLALGRLYIMKRRYTLASESLNKALKLTRQPALKWKIWFHIGKVYEESGQTDTALAAYQKSITIIEALRGAFKTEELKSAFVSDKVVVYDSYIHLLLGELAQDSDKEIFEEAFAMNERARARGFLDMLGNQKIGGAVSLQNEETTRREQQLRIKIRQLNQKIQGTTQRSLLTELSRELHRTQQEYQDLLLEIKLHHPDYSDLISVDPPPLAEIQKKLDAKSLIMEYWVGEKQITVWLVSHKGLEIRSLRVTRSDLKRQLNLFRNSIGIHSTEHIIESLQGLYQLLIRPFEADLEPYEHLIVIPHGGLHFLPLAR